MILSAGPFQLGDANGFQDGFLKEGLADAPFHFHQEIFFESDLGQADPLAG